MAFPQVAAANGGYDTVTSTNHTINLPAGIEAGDLLIVFIASDGDPIFYWPAGWSLLFFHHYEYDIRFTARYRIADGGEGATILVTSNDSESTAHTSYRITGYSGVPEVGLVDTWNNNTPDPYLTTPSWGAKDTLWIAAEGNEGADATITGYPANYTNGRCDQIPGGGSIQATVGTARRERNASTENPGPFTLSGAKRWCACTVAIQPVAVVEKTSSETGSGTDVKKTDNPLATLPVRSEAGSGADAKATGNPIATLARSETGGGVDGHKAVAPQSVGESGSGVDAILNYLASLTRADSGVGVDTLLTHLASLLGSDIGAGVENIPGRDLVIVEPGSGVDVSHLFKDLILSDGGTCVLENSYLRIIQAVKHSSDLGSGLDISGLDALFQRQDSGEAIEQILARAIFAEEYPAGAVDLANVLTAIITGEEVGTGVEQSLKAYYQKTGEAGVGSESSITDFVFKSSDFGYGAEAITLLAALVAHDTGVSVEAVIEFFKKAIDSGQGEENLRLVGWVGRRMRMVVYQREAFDLKVYTSEVGK